MPRIIYSIIIGNIGDMMRGGVNTLSLYSIIIVGDMMRGGVNTLSIIYIGDMMRGGVNISYYILVL